MNNKTDLPDNESIDEDHLFHFPCEFSLKVMGEDVDNYADYVLSVCQKHIDHVDPANVKTRPSRNAKYLAVTVTFTATSREQLDKLYHELNACKHTKMAL